MRRLPPALVALALFCSPVIFAAGGPATVVVRPEDVVTANTRGSIVDVSVSPPKAKELIHKSKNTAIELSIPNFASKEMFICETHYGRFTATISFKFPNESSAADFAEQLMAARAKALGDCNCH